VKRYLKNVLLLNMIGEIFCRGPNDFCRGPAPVGPTLATGPTGCPLASGLA